MAKLFNPVHRTVAHLIIVFCVMLIAVWSRLFYLQVIKQKQLETRSVNNFIRMNKIDVPRGDIVDTNGNILATSRLIMSLYWQGTGKSTLTENQKQLLETLSNYAPLTIDRALLTTIAHVERHEKVYRLAKDLSFEQISCIAEQCAHEPNVLIKSHFRRYYPFDNFASHFIGYLVYQDVETHAKMGIEKLYQDELKGDPGIKQYMVNAIGKPLTTEEYKTGSAGKTVRTTLDMRLQNIAEEVFPENMAGCIIIMDPKTGALRVLLSRPSFNPSLFLKPLSQQDWQAMQEKKPFLNRACNACYPPASLFKLITMSAALETNIITPDACRVCHGYYPYRGRKYHCNCREGHGFVTFEQSLAKSCNIIFFDIGKRISIDTLADYANRYGLGKPTGIAFAEQLGLVPSSQWKRKHKGERWWQGETLSAAIGQTYLLATPMQIARMVGSISQGFLVKPRLLEDEPINKEPLKIKPETLTFLRRAMHLAAQEGTAQLFSSLPNFTIYAKTGTAQVSGFKEGQKKCKIPSHAWFAGNITYKNTPPFTLIIFVEHAGGSQVPIRVAYQLLRAYARII